MGFSKQELAAYRDSTVPDLIGDQCELLFVGINPGLWTAATQTHFCHPSNRFYPALLAAGLIDWKVDTDIGMTDEQKQDFTAKGMGITNLVERATVRASELSRHELRVGAGGWPSWQRISNRVWLRLPASPLTGKPLPNAPRRWGSNQVCLLMQGSGWFPIPVG